MKTFAGRRLGRSSDHRASLLKNLTEGLIQNEKIRTTVPRAKELRRYAEKVITIAKKENVLHAQRRVAKRISLLEARRKLFEVLVPRYQSREGGYTQIIRIAPRAGDAAPMTIIRLLP